MSLQVAEAHHAAQVRQGEATAILASRQWQHMSLIDLDRSWARIVERLVLIVASAQLGAAKAGAAYVAQMVAGIDPVASVNPAAWSGFASDGRPLDSLLFGAVTHTKSLIGGGYDQDEAVFEGGKWLDMAVRTQVSDADRGAAGAAIAARPRVGYERYVSPPCCQRCAVLAGKFYRWNAGFLRHPRCDCKHYPAVEGTDEDPQALADHMKAVITPDSIKDLTRAQRQAIDDGADMNQVINSHRVGARSKDKMTTSEGTTRRGYASYVKRAVARQRGEAVEEVVTRAGKSRRNATRVKQRLTPEAIYRLSGTREEALRLLRQNGYIVGDIRQIAAKSA